MQQRGGSERGCDQEFSAVGVFAGNSAKLLKTYDEQFQKWSNP
jgi:hypothetical protein